jgi:hypothetical protein
MVLMKERFLNKVARNDSGCWEWAGYRTPDGYGRFQVDSSRLAHRVAYELFVGPIDDGMEIDHLCKNRGCVNPEHLEQVSRHENIARSDAGKHQREKLSCPQGHPYSGDNLYLTPDGKRVCRICQRAAVRRYRASIQ